MNDDAFWLVIDIYQQPFPYLKGMPYLSLHLSQISKYLKLLSYELTLTIHTKLVCIALT